MIEDFVIIIAVISSVIVSHLLKEFFHVWREGEWSWYVLLWQTGGMPSSHSAGVSALATAVGLVDGFSTAFWISLVLAVVVIRDAFGVRRSVSDQARILNVLVSRVKVEQKVKVVLGHTPIQTLAGTLIGATVAIAVWLVL